LFSLKQKLLKKDFHPLVFHKFKTEAQRYERAIEVFYFPSPSNDALQPPMLFQDDSPAQFISTYLSTKSKVQLLISACTNFSSLSQKIDEFIALQLIWTKKWLGIYSKSAKAYNFPSYDEMIWVQIKNWIINSEVDDWNVLTKVNELPDFFVIEIERLHAMHPYFNR
jgi:hypothetical protein